MKYQRDRYDKPKKFFFEHSAALWTLPFFSRRAPSRFSNRSSPFLSCHPRREQDMMRP
jgi:hypothetical protein